jgi:hypothetical protein
MKFQEKAIEYISNCNQQLNLKLKIPSVPTITSLLNSFEKDQNFNDTPIKLLFVNNHKKIEEIQEKAYKHSGVFINKVTQRNLFLDEEKPTMHRIWRVLNNSQESISAKSDYPQVRDIIIEELD